MSSMNPGEAEAYEAIDWLADFYRVGCPEEFANRRSELDAALAEFRRLYTNSNFSDMGLNCHQDVLCSRCHPGGIVSIP